jgi:hypothetical protein
MTDRFDSSRKLTEQQKQEAYDHYFLHYYKSRDNSIVHERYGLEVMGLEKENAQWYAKWAVSEIDSCKTDEFDQFYCWYYENYVTEPPAQFIIIILF